MQETEKLRERGASQLLPEEGVRGGVAVALAERKDFSIYLFSFRFHFKTWVLFI